MVGMRVLLIEDDRTTARSIELMLKAESFNLYITDVGEEGIDLGKVYDYDIILLDLNLPDLSGFEVLRTLRVSKVEDARSNSVRACRYREQGKSSRLRR
jgi:two-component system cell cycle response regulator CtrA